MDYYKSTRQIRAEVKNNYVYIRNVCKDGVIDALLTERTSKKVCAVLQQVGEETFSQVWDKMNAIKGVRFDFKSI